MDTPRSGASTPGASTPQPTLRHVPAAERPVHRYYGVGRLDGYHLGEKIGSGTFGTVYRGTNKMTRADVALKEIKVREVDDGIPITALREIKYLKKLQKDADGKNIVKLHEIACNAHGENIHLVFEYVEFDLCRILPTEYQNTFPEQNVRHYMQKLLTALAHMHQKSIMHRDIKSANILVDRNGGLKLADFGLARSILPPSDNKEYTPTVVTLWYRPPELLLGELKYDESIDMWGAGCILAEFFLREPLFKTKHEDKPEGQLQQLMDIFALCGSPDEKDWPEIRDLKHYSGISFKVQPRLIMQRFSKYGEQAADLIDKLLALNPRKRLTAKEALNHPWIKQDMAIDKTTMNYKDPRKQSHAQQNYGPALMPYQGSRPDFDPSSFAGQRHSQPQLMYPNSQSHQNRPAPRINMPPVPSRVDNRTGTSGSSGGGAGSSYPSNAPYRPHQPQQSHYAAVPHPPQQQQQQQYGRYNSSRSGPGMMAQQTAYRPPLPYQTQVSAPLYQYGPPQPPPPRGPPPPLLAAVAPPPPPPSANFVPAQSHHHQSHHYASSSRSSTSSSRREHDSGYDRGGDHKRQRVDSHHQSSAPPPPHASRQPYGHSGAPKPPPPPGPPPKSVNPPLPPQPPPPPAEPARRP